MTNKEVSKLWESWSDSGDTTNKGMLSEYYLAQDIRITTLIKHLFRNEDDSDMLDDWEYKTVEVVIRYPFYSKINIPLLHNHPMKKYARGIGYVYWQVTRIVAKTYKEERHKIGIPKNRLFSQLKFSEFSVQKDRILINIISKK